MRMELKLNDYPLQVVLLGEFWKSSLEEPVLVHKDLSVNHRDLPNLKPYKDLADMIKRCISMPKQPHAKHSLCKVAGENNYGHTAVRYKTHVIVLGPDGTKILDLVTGQWMETDTSFGLEGKRKGDWYHTCTLIRGHWLIHFGGGYNKDGRVWMLYLKD